jgi:hypothetical protein
MQDGYGEMLDTSEEKRRRYYELLARLSPGQKAAKVSGLSAAVRLMAVAGIRRQFPEASEAEVRVHLARRLYGDAVAERVARADQLRT